MTETTTTLERIETLCKIYAEARAALKDRTDRIVQLQEKVLRRRRKGLQGRIAAASVAEDELMEAIRGAKSQFERPKSRTFSGIKIGWRKKPGKIVVADEDRTKELIRKKFPDQAKTLLVTKTSLDKAALAKLPVKDLAKVGATLAESTDEAFLTAPKSNLDKLVEAFLADMRDWEDEQ